MNARRLARAGAVIAISAIVTIGLIAEYRLRTEPEHRQTGHSVASQTVAGEPIPAGDEQTIAARPPIGPPSPLPPIYGPPTPPSRVPLLDPSRRFNAPILNVTGEDVVPRDASNVERLAPIGWDRLTLDRGIPFVDRFRRDQVGGPSPNEARQSLFQRAAPEPAPVSVAYCVDPSIGVEDPRMLDEVRRRIKRAAESLRPGDRLTLFALDAAGSAMMDGWSHAEGMTPDAWSRFDALGPSDGTLPAPGLIGASAMTGISHIVAVASARGALEEAEVARLRELASGAPPCIVLVIGDGTATPRARALRDLAAATRGAFAWLRPAADDAPAEGARRLRP